jgi:hypothetical protein
MTLQPIPSLAGLGLTWSGHPRLAIGTKDVDAGDIRAYYAGLRRTTPARDGGET